MKLEQHIPLLFIKYHLYVGAVWGLGTQKQIYNKYIKSHPQEAYIQEQKDIHILSDGKKY